MQNCLNIFNANQTKNHDADFIAKVAAEKQRLAEPKVGGTDWRRITWAANFSPHTSNIENRMNANHVNIVIISSAIFRRRVKILSADLN